jgi:hypothetical protein
VFIGKTGSSGQKAEMTQEERKAQGIFESVKVEAEKDIESIKLINQQADKTNEADFNNDHIQEKNFLDKEE